DDGIRDRNVTGVQTCALPISGHMGGVQGDALVAAPRSMAAWADGRAGGSMGRGFIGLRHLLAHDFAMESFVPRRVIVCKGRHASPPQWPVSHIYRPHLSSPYGGYPQNRADVFKCQPETA